jgi:chromosome segregation ATPase
VDFGLRRLVFLGGRFSQLFPGRRVSMSTAGKVLVVLIMLASLVWMVLMAGVTQLNRNGNQALKNLDDKVVQLTDDVQTARSQIVEIKDQTSVLQEQMDKDLTVIRSRQLDVERVSSNIKEILSRVQYQLATLGETVKNAEAAAKQRADEKVAEQKALDDARADVRTLKGQNQELTNRLTGLRNEFKSTLKTNASLIGKAVK